MVPWYNDGKTMVLKCNPCTMVFIYSVFLPRTPKYGGIMVLLLIVLNNNDITI